MARALTFFIHPNDLARSESLRLISDGADGGSGAGSSPSPSPPWAFRSEIDHGLLQPYLAARAAGLAARLVSRIESDAGDAGILVVHARQIAGDPRLGAAVHAARERVVMLRGSAGGELPGRWEVVADAGAPLPPHAGRIEIPPLPQIGMVPRDPARGLRLERVVTKGWRVHQPPYVTSGQLAAAIAPAPLRLALDLEMEDAEGRRRWHDFTRADVVLALRSDEVLGGSSEPREPRARGETGKPPTRLVNAWVAGAIPVVSPEAVYLRVGRPGEDMLVVNDQADLVATLGRLCAEPDRAGRLFAASRARGAGFAWDVTASRYVAFFASLLG